MKKIVKNQCENGNTFDPEEKECVDIKLMNMIRETKKDFDEKGSRAFKKDNCYDFAEMMWRNTPDSKIYFVKNKRHYVLKSKGNYYDVDGLVKIDSGDKLESDDPLETNR
jgi:hypothetical protein